MATEAKQPQPEYKDIEIQPDAIARYEAPTGTLALTPVFDLDTAKKRLHELQEFVRFYMNEGEDYGTIPGTPKPTLYKPGADKLCDIYGIADTYRISNRTEDWSKNLFDYEVECTLVNKRDGHLVATGLGSCNSFEGRYRWRDQKRVCPLCGKPTIIKGKAEWGGGWICWKKEGRSDGCGGKFADDDAEITKQIIGKIENEDIPSLKNTILKMAKKRAKVDAVLSATRSSGLFTQDIEDWTAVEEAENRGTKQSAERVGKKIVEEKQKEIDSRARKEKVEVIPHGDGMVALSGDGLAILGSNVNGGIATFATWLDVGKCWVMPTEDVGRLKATCKKLNVPFLEQKVKK